MITHDKAVADRPSSELNRERETVPIDFRGFAIAAASLVLGFGPLFIELMRFSVESDFHSYILLVPFISAYLVWIKRTTLSGATNTDRKGVWILSGAGIAFLGAYFLPRFSGVITYAQSDSLAIGVVAFVLLFAAVCHWFLEKRTVRAVSFPLVFLAFMAPIPEFFSKWMEIVSQHGSAVVAHVFFKLAGTPVFRQDLFFQLPGFRLQVAPECSGIHSTIALCLTSLVAGHLFLRSPGRRVVLVAAVFPLALLRNGLRVFTIGELCVHVGPEMIDSPIHHHGGPLFFLLSLIPFSFLLFWLFRSEKRAGQRTPQAIGN